MWRPSTLGAAGNGGETARASGGQPGVGLGVPEFIGADRLPSFDFIDQLFVLRALILRDIRVRYRDNPFGFPMEFFRIVVVVAAHYTIFSIRNKAIPAGIPIELFVIAGFSVWFTFSRTVGAAAKGADWPAGASNLPGVTRMHIRLAKSAWVVLCHLLFCFTSVLFLKFAGDDLRLPDIPLTVLLVCMAGFVGFGYGLSVDGLSVMFPVVDSISKTFKWALFITSGIYFSISLTPPILEQVFWYNPMVHLIEYERYAFDPAYPIALITLVYPAAIGGGLMFFGLILNRYMRNQDKH
jgi:capsular polysaccharide transport system permease protein